MCLSYPALPKTEDVIRVVLMELELWSTDLTLWTKGSCQRRQGTDDCLVGSLLDRDGFKKLKIDCYVWVIFFG